MPDKLTPAEIQKLTLALDAALPGAGVAALVDKHYAAILKPPNGKHGEHDESPELHPIKTRWTLQELLTTEFPEPRWAIPDLLPVGLSFLAGRPKLGKSWLALQIAHAVATGGVALGKRVEKGRVLFIALEDSSRRLQGRIRKQGIPSDADITFLTNFDSLASGGLVNLQEEITQGSYRLVVIDTFSRAVGKADQLDPAEMTVVTGSLQRLAQNLDVAILIIDHHRKTNGFESSPIDDILGSTAKAAVIDCAIGLYREKGKHEAELKITGRDIEEQELALKWDAQFCCWQNLGDANDVKTDSLKGEIMRAIRELGEDGELATNKRIASYLEHKPSNVYMALGDLIATGKVKKGAKQGREVPYVLT